MFSNTDFGHVKNVVSHGENPLSHALQNSVQETLLFANESLIFDNFPHGKNSDPRKCATFSYDFLAPFAQVGKVSFPLGELTFPTCANGAKNHR